MGDVRSTVGGWLEKMPFVTRNVILTCIVLYVGQLLLGVSVGHVCNLPALMLHEPSELWRLLTAGFFHMGLLHLALNMISMQSLGASLETNMGSFLLGYLILLFNACVSGLHFTLAIIVSRYFDSPEYERQCSVGFSGVLFALLTVRCSSSDQQSQSSVFGLTSVPTRFYPWVLLLALQFLMPNISFIGHLSGIFVGYFFTFGIFQPIIPSGRRISSWESTSFLQCIVMCRGYIIYPDTALSSASHANSRSWLSYLWSSASPTLLPPSKQYEGKAASSNFVGQGYVLGSTQSRGENKPAESAAAAAVMRLHLMTQIPVSSTGMSTTGTSRTGSMPSLSTPSSQSPALEQSSTTATTTTSKEIPVSPSQ